MQSLRSNPTGFGSCLGRTRAWVLATVMLLFPLACMQVRAADAGWQSLFNGRDLSGWDTYLAPLMGETKPLGLNHDPKGVFTVQSLDGAPAIRVSGEVYGAITTHASFTNFHFRLQYKWGPAKWPPRNGPRHYRDSGILYWCVGPHGAGSQAWMKSVECNIMEKGVGQWWSVAGAYCDAEAVRLIIDQAPWIPYRGEADGERIFVYQQGFPHVTVPNSDGITASMDYEKAYGEWNDCEVIAWGNVGIHRLNGKVNLVLTKPRYREGDREVALEQGKIQLQSEAAELFYRKVEVRAIEEIPTELLSVVPAQYDTDAGFTALLPERGSAGWAQCGPGQFEVESSVATGRGGMGLWWYTNRMFTNFVLRGEWQQVEPIADSGVFVRFPNPGQDPWNAVKLGHEMEIGDPKPAKVEETTGAIYPFKPPVAVTVKPYGEWNDYELVCVGHNYSVRINGVLVNSWTDSTRRSAFGYVGLQNYNDGKTVRHRNLRIRELAPGQAVFLP